VEGRRQHPAVESAINNLNQRGLDLVRTHGKEGFGRTVALSVVAANMHRLGFQLKRKEERLRRWHQARKRAA
ncbi:MAG: ISNCY family transposase, partial [Bacteroidetes bacterium]|nr:ISNCY family transposase [Bacteroidota bacterium]